MTTSTGSLSFERGLYLNVLSVFLNAVAMTISKFAFAGVDSIAVTLVICCTSALVSLLYMRMKGLGFSRDELKKLTPIAVINALATLFLYASIAILDPVIVGIIGRFYVVFTTLLACLILREKLGRLEIILIALAFAGTLLFAQKDQNAGSLHYLGVAMGLAYTFLFALANLFVKKSIHRTSSIVILFYNNLFASIACFILLQINGSSIDSLRTLSGKAWIYAIAASVVTFLGLVLFFNSYRFLSFKFSNLIRSTSPVFVALVSWPFFPVQLNTKNFIGAGLVLSSIVLLTTQEKRKK